MCIELSLLLDTPQGRLPHLQHVVPGRGPPRVYVEVGVAVLDTDQAVLGHFGFSQQSIVRPIVLHPGQLLNDVRRLYKAGHPYRESGEQTGSFNTEHQEPSTARREWDCYWHGKLGQIFSRHSALHAENQGKLHRQRFKGF